MENYKLLINTALRHILNAFMHRLCSKQYGNQPKNVSLSMVGNKATAKIKINQIFVNF